MRANFSRRVLLHATCGATAALSMPSFAAQRATDQTASEELFYRDDWFGEPWRKPETAVLIHGNHESSIVWYGWIPRMAQEFRVLRPDLPAFGRSKIPAGMDWSLPGLARYVAQVLDKAGVQSAHIIGAKTGGAIAMQFAADYPNRTLTLSVASGPASRIEMTQETVNQGPARMRARLGSRVSKEQVEYWNAMFEAAPEKGIEGLGSALSKFDLARDGVLQRIKAPTLVMTADRSGLQSVEKVLQYQRQIPNSRLVVLGSDSYHIAASNPDECATNVLAFIHASRQKS